MTTATLRRRAGDTTTATHDSRPLGRPTRLAIRLDTRCNASRWARLALNGHCAGLFPQELTDNLTLVASELVTNAIRHGGRGIITLDLSARDDRVSLTITSAGAGRNLPPTSEWRLPGNGQIGGRGLALASLLADSVAVHRGEGIGGAPSWLAVTAEFAR